MSRRQYRTLVASLPALPRPERATRLPINETRLRGRFKLLSEADRHQLKRVLDVVRWKALPLDRTDAAQVAHYQAALQELSSRAVLTHLATRMDHRTLMAGLRHRLLQPEAPPAGVWGTGRYRPWIERHWQAPDFDLAGVFPWLPAARSFLEAGQSLQLEQLLLRQAWQGAVRLADSAEPFSFEHVCAYVLRWDVLNRHLSYRERRASGRFDTLVSELIHGHA